MAEKKGVSVQEDKEKAEGLLKQVQQLDQGQGIGIRVDHLEFVISKASTFLESEYFGEALDNYKNAILGAQALLDMDQTRQQAKKAQEKTLDAEALCIISGASSHAAEKWNTAKHTLALANLEFEAGNFDNAAAKWEQAQLELKLNS